MRSSVSRFTSKLIYRLPLKSTAALGIFVAISALNPIRSEAQYKQSFTFTDNDWSTITILSGAYYDGNSGFSESGPISGVSSDGNPLGNSLYITTHVSTWSANSINESTSTTTVYSADSTHVYDPAFNGAISSLSFSVDAVADYSATGWGDQIVGGFQGNGFFLVQNGETYIADVGYTTPSSWTNHAYIGLTASDFVRWGPGAYQVTAQHPDFSASGANIDFGVTGSNSTGNYGGPYGTTVYFDNFIVTAYTPAATPEPSGYAFLITCALALKSARRMRHRR